MSGSVTVKDIAREAMVSVGTVSRVFNNHQNVTEEIRLRVLRAAEALGYTRLIGQDIPSRSTSRTLKEIGFVFYSSVSSDRTLTTNPFWSHILEGVEQEARKHSIKVTYHTMGGLLQSPQELISDLQEKKLGGILLVGPVEAEIVSLVNDLGLPLVLVDNYISGLSVDAVLCDNFEGARLAVEYLIALGHSRIAFIGGPLLKESPRPINKIFTFERRAAGYRTALLDAGLEVDYRLFESCNITPESSYEACKRLLAEKRDFSALFCANDEIAIGAMKALHESGYRIPEDVSLIGFDNIHLVEYLIPALTTVSVHKEALGSTAVKRLLERFAEPESDSITSLLEVELIKRHSVRSLLDRNRTE